MRYRQVCGTPLEPAYLGNGWTSHLLIHYRPDEPGYTTNWEADAVGFALRHVVAQMKTNRPKDRPIVNARGYQMRNDYPEQALLALRNAFVLLHVWAACAEHIRLDLANRGTVVARTQAVAYLDA